MKNISRNKLFIFGSIFLLLWIFIENFLLNINLSLIIAFLLLFLLLNFYLYTKKFFIYLFIIFSCLLFWVSYSNFYNSKIIQKQNFL